MDWVGIKQGLARFTSYILISFGLGLAIGGLIVSAGLYIAVGFSIIMQGLWGLAVVRDEKAMYQERAKNTPRSDLDA